MSETIGTADLDKFIRRAELKQFAFAKRALQIATELRDLRTPAGEADFWAVHSVTGSHIGLWRDEAYARNVLSEYVGGTITPLYTHPSPVSEGVTFQDRVEQAHRALFHDDPTDLAERRDRFGEESNELQQALGQTREDAHKLVDYTYDRPEGEPPKEIGASMLTLASLCIVGGWDMMACAEADLAALVTPEKIAKVRAKRATRHGRGPLPGLAAVTEGK